MPGISQDGAQNLTSYLTQRDYVFFYHKNTYDFFLVTDIAVTTRNQIEFYTNNTKTYTEKDVPFRDLSTLVYDAVHNMLLYADKQNDNASIFSYYIPTKKYQPVVRKMTYANIHGLAVDPVNRILFWTSEGSIYSISLQPDARHDDYGMLFLATKDIPRAIAIDSCRGCVS